MRQNTPGVGIPMPRNSARHKDKRFDPREKKILGKVIKLSKGVVEEGDVII